MSPQNKAAAAELSKLLPILERGEDPDYNQALALMKLAEVCPWEVRVQIESIAELVGPIMKRVNPSPAEKRDEEEQAASWREQAVKNIRALLKSLEGDALPS